MVRHLAKIIAVFFLAASGLAQDADSAAQAAIESLQKQVRELQQQVQALQVRLDGQATANAPAIPTPEPVASPELPPKEDRSIHMRGFGEVDYKALDQRSPEIGAGGFVPGSAGNFYTNEFDLLLTASLSNRASILSEVTFGETDAQQFNVDLARMLLNYDFDDHLRVSVGRYQTAIGYYNTTYNSGVWVQTSVDRPLIMEFPDHGGILPVRAIGASFQGALPSGKLNLHYIFGYGSSDTIRSHLDGSAGVDDENNGNQINLGVFARPDWLHGLQVGGSFYHDKISDDRDLSIRYGQTILNGHAVYAARGWELISEGILVRLTQQSGFNAFNMPGFYTQAAKQFGKVRPFFRYQYVNTNPRSPLHDVLLRYGPSFGARYDFDSNIAFKLQFDHTARKSLPDLNGVQTQLAFTF